MILSNSFVYDMGALWLSHAGDLIGDPFDIPRVYLCHKGGGGVNKSSAWDNNYIYIYCC